MKLKVLEVVILVTIFTFSCALSSPLAKTYATQARAVTEQDHDSYRLPKTVKPLNYVVTLTPNIKGNSESEFRPWPFVGSVEITVSVEEETDHITLHSNNIEIVEVITEDKSKKLSFETSGDDHQFLIIRADDNSNFKTGNLTITIKYVGYLEDDMAGFYRSYYYQDGEKRWLGITQFESTGARRAFPCFDEPSFKATFEIRISVEENFTAISNMPLKKNSTSGNSPRTLFEFEKTEPMSTYLVAFMVADFGFVESKEMDLRVWARSNAIDDTAFSIAESAKILKALEKFLNVNYTLSKMDEVAVPDFAAGAMENWGLVTYRERLLLFNSALSTTANKQGIFTTIAHEFAHQWFGDLVSPEWWSYTWLNEGFATYFESFISHELNNKWRLDEQFVVKAVQSALAADASATSRPMTSSVGSPTQIQQVFDVISYQKAGSVIRMLEHFLSHEVFRSGLELYLNTKALESAVPEDLFTALTDGYDNSSISFDPMELMRQWSEQGGYPLVSVSSLENGLLTLKQEQFFLNKSITSNANWIIPITYACLDEKDAFSNTTPRIYMTGSELVTEIKSNLSNLCLFNVKQSGYYRVNYEPSMWSEIIALLHHENSIDILPPLIRAQLLDDSFALAKAQKIGYEIPITLSRYLVQEMDYIPWYSALNSLSFINNRLQGTENYTAFSEFVVQLLSNVYYDVHFKEVAEDDHVRKLLQNLVLSWMCKLGHQDCIEQSVALFSTMSNSTSKASISPDLQGVVYCTAVREGTKEDWNFLWERYLSSNVATEKTLILSALACANNQELIDKLLLTAIRNPDEIRRQDVQSVFSAVYTSPGGVDLALEFLSNNFEELLKYSKQYKGAAASLVLGIASRITTSEQIIKLADILEHNNQDDILHPAVEMMEQNSQWLESNQETLSALINDAISTTTPISVETTTKGAGSISPALYLILLLSASYLYLYVQ